MTSIILKNATVALLVVTLLTGCGGDPASCWDGRPISCEQARKNEINRVINEREMERGR
mgnify:CR=1 FL=1